MEENVQNQIIRLSTLKLKPYKKFIKKLLKIEGQGIVFEKDYRKLCDLFKGRIMLYLKKESTEMITANMINIGRCVGLGNKNFRLREELRTPVIEIINILMENMGFGGKLDETVIEELERAEDEFFPRFFKQALKEALDNVLVNYSDYCVFNRGEFVQEKDGEYIIFSLSFSFDDRDSLAPFRRNYAEIAFALSQRVKYIFLQACVGLEGMYLYEYIARLEKIDPFSIYPEIPWELTESGDIVY